MERVPPFNAQQLTSIAKVLGNTRAGLTGSEIEYLLRDCRIPDVNPEMTKWKRLFNAFVEFQNKRQLGNGVLMFINRAMNPALYTSLPGVFAERRDQLNTVLAFSGMTVGEDGKVRRAPRAKSLQDAMERASRLRSALTTRKVHADVLKFCKAELLQENYFHAVFEAMKSIAAKIRTLSGLTTDGAWQPVGSSPRRGGEWSYLSLPGELHRDSYIPSRKHHVRHTFQPYCSACSPYHHVAPDHRYNSLRRPGLEKEVLETSKACALQFLQSHGTGPSVVLFPLEYSRLPVLDGKCFDRGVEAESSILGPVFGLTLPLT